MDIQTIKDRLRENRNKQKDFLEACENFDSDSRGKLENMENEEKKLVKELAFAEEEEKRIKASVKPSDESKDSEEVYAKEVFPKWLMNKALTPEEKKVMEEMNSRANLGTGSSGGGNLVPTSLQNEIIEAMQFYGGAREFGRIITTSGGEDMTWPFTDNTSKKASIVSENPGSDVAVDNPTFTAKTLSSFNYTSKEIKVSRQLLQDVQQGIDLVEFITSEIAKRFGRGLNTHFTTGDGSSKPEGVVTASTLGKTTANTDSVTRDEIVDFIHSVDRDHRLNAMLMLSDNTLAEIKKLSIGSSDARPLWQPSMREAEPDRLEGYPYIINNDMADIGSGNKFMIFGDGDSFIIRDIGRMSIQRLEELHALRYQTGWVAFSRHDCKLVDTGAVKHMRNTTT